VKNAVVEDATTVHYNEYTETALQKDCGFFRVSDKATASKIPHIPLRTRIFIRRKDNVISLYLCRSAQQKRTSF
jgi:hypothetical protein